MAQKKEVEVCAGLGITRLPAVSNPREHKPVVQHSDQHHVRDRRRDVQLDHANDRNSQAMCRVETRERHEHIATGKEKKLRHDELREHLKPGLHGEESSFRLRTTRG